MRRVILVGSFGPGVAHGSVSKQHIGPLVRPTQLWFYHDHHRWHYKSQPYGGSFGGDIPDPMFPENPFFRFVDIFPGPLTGVPLSNCPPDEQFGPFNLCFKFSSGTFTYSGGGLDLKGSLEGGFAGVGLFHLPENPPSGYSFITPTILPGHGITGGLRVSTVGF